MSNFGDIEAPSSENATDRIGIRMRPGDKERISRAAELTGVRLTAFVRASAVREAERILRGHQTTALSERDWRTLLEAPDDPPTPTAAARDAVRDYRPRIANAG